MRKIRKALIFVIFNILALALLVIVVEGVSNIIEVMGRTGIVAERHHTEYDSELGWVNMPNVHIEDMYGPGVYLKTNSQLFRNNEDFSEKVPDGKVRIICSGDSFTLGYGVDNDHTWCQRLVSIDGRLETVNMGQGGYGVDQSYLWYKRDGAKLDQDIHLFAFITDDFRRMLGKKMGGYGKPVLALEDGLLVVGNVPVPKRSYYMPWLTSIRRTAKGLKTVELLRRLLRRRSPSPLVSVGGQKEDPHKAVVSRIFQDLKRMSQTRGGTLVLVHLPAIGDFMGAGSEPWREFLAAEARKQDIILIDLIEEFRKRDPQKIRGMFFKAHGHYTEEGNAYIARALYDRLLAVPEISDKLPAALRTDDNTPPGNP